MTPPSPLWNGFLVGLLGSAHCLGMCGGFIAHLSCRREALLARQLLWHAGRISSYLLLGALAGSAGRALGSLGNNPAQVQKALGLLSGALMLLAGLHLLGLLPIRLRANYAGPLSGLCRSIMATPGPGAALVMGIAAGWLPCPMVVALLGYNLADGSVAHGMLAMAGLGLGSLVSLLPLGLAGRWLRPWRWGSRAGGTVLVLLGLGVLLRGTPLYQRLLGCGEGHARQQHSHVLPSCCTTDPTHGNHDTHGNR